MGIAQLTATVCTALVCACTPVTAQFDAAERATARTADGYAAAEYDIDTSAGDLGNAKVWSEGAYVTTLDGQERSIIHLAMEIANRTDRPLVLDLDHTYLDSATLDDTELVNVPVYTHTGETTIPPGNEQQIDLYFSLHTSVSPTDIQAFRLSWALRDDGRIYVERTPFLRDREPTYLARYYYTPYYDPFFYDPDPFGPSVVLYDRPYYHHSIHHHPAPPPPAQGGVDVPEPARREPSSPATR